MSIPQSISIVLPALNEAQDLPETLRRAQAVPEVCEIILADGGSRDGTPDMAAREGCKIISTSPSRGKQMRLGAQRAKGDVVLFLHADTWLPADAGQAALHCFHQANVVGGGYWKAFRETPWLMAGARLKCALRLYLRGNIFGDQAMFVRRNTLETIGGVPDIPLMEDVELSRRFRRVGRLVLAHATVTTSARRFQENGVLRTYWRIWWVNMLYRLGVSPKTLKRIYERTKKSE